MFVSFLFSFFKISFHLFSHNVEVNTGTAQYERALVDVVNDSHFRERERVEIHYDRMD